MGGRRSTVAGARRTPRLSLIARSIHFGGPPGEWFRHPVNVTPLVDALARSGLAPPTISIREIGRRGRTVGPWGLVKDRLRDAAGSVLEISPADAAARRFELHLHRGGDSLVVDWTFPVDDATLPGTRSMLRELLKRIHDEYCQRATVGPVLAIVPRWLPYPRPTPPRVHAQWPAGSVTVAACRRGYARGHSGGAARFEALSTAELPPGITRRHSGDLLLLDVDATAGDRLGDQRAALERWIRDATVDDRFETAIDRFDAIDAEDPERVSIGGRDRPRGVVYAERMTAWLHRLDPAASPELQLAVRAQHIARWRIPRADYPDGRAGYRRWRSELGRMHARIAGEVMTELGCAPAAIERVGKMLVKAERETDPEVQTLEDVACLVFLEHYFDDFAAGHDDDKLVGILARTWSKMSARGHAAARELADSRLSDRARELLARALTDDGATSPV